MGVQLELGQIYLWDPCLSCSKICWLSEIKAMTSAKVWLTYLFSAKKCPSNHAINFIQMINLQKIIYLNTIEKTGL